jgi:hypothetical protein
MNRAWEARQLRDLGAELQADPALAETVTGRSELFPAVPEELEAVLVRTRRHDIDRGIARALALAVAGISAQVDFAEETDAS